MVSQINTSVPAQGAPGQSAPVRTNFQIASAEITALQSGTGIGTQTIHYNQLQAETQSTLLGNPWGTSQSPAEIQLGASLTFVTGSLQTTAMTNDVVSPANSLAGTIAAGAVTNAKFRSSVGLSVVGNAGTVTGTVADIVGVNGQVLTVTGSVLRFGSVPAGAGGFGTTSLTPNNIVIGNGTNPPALTPPVASGNILLDQGVGTNPAFFAMAGDAGIVNTGTITVTRVNSVSYPSAAATPNRVAVVSSAGTVTYIQAPNAALANSTITVAGTATALGGTVGNQALANSLGSDVALNNLGSYFDGPSVAQGTVGTWFASGQVTVSDPAGAAIFAVKLWDGATVFNSCVSVSQGSSQALAIPMSGFIAAPAGNIRISVRDTASNTGTIKFNQSGLSKDSTITVVRIG